MHPNLIDMKIDKNICIRVNRDEVQIAKSKQLLVNQSMFLEQQAQLFNLLGNVVRLRIVFLLLHDSKLCVCDLSDILGMKIPAISQHLRKLKDGGLLHSKREGTIIYYHIKLEKLDEIKNLFNQKAILL